MAPLSGRLEADFAAFDTAIKNSLVQLKTFEEGGAKVSGQLNRVANSLSGTRLIADAAVMTEAVSRIGGATKLTESEQRRVNLALDEALQKYAALGQQAPAAMVKLHTETSKLATVTDGAAASHVKLGSGLSNIDNILGGLGINIGNEARAIKQLGEHAETSGGKLDLLGKAGLIVGAGVAGWKIGRAAADFFDLDTKIGNATAKLLGWGDAAAQEAAAKADVLALATKNAGYAVTDYSAAIEINRLAAQKWAEDQKKAADAIDKTAAAARNATGDKINNDAIEINNRAKLLQAQQAIDANAIETQKKKNEVFRKSTEAIQAQVPAYDASAAAAGRYRESGVDAANRIMAEQAKELAAAQALNEERERAIKLNRQMGGSFDVTRANFAQTARGLGQSEGLIETLLKKGYSFQQAMLWANHPDWPPPENPGPRVPGFARGVENFGGGVAMVGERGPELVQLPKGSNVLPFGRGGSGGPSITITNYINGTGHEIAAIVTRQIMNQLKTQRQLSV